MDNFKPADNSGFFGWLSVAISMLFRVEPSVVLAAFIGSMAAVILINEISRKSGFVAIIGCTYAISTLVPDIALRIHVTNESIALVASFSLIYFFKPITEAVKKIIKNYSEKIGTEKE